MGVEVGQWKSYPSEPTCLIYVRLVGEVHQCDLDRVKACEQEGQLHVDSEPNHMN